MKRKFDYAATNSDDEICVLSRYRNVIEARCDRISFDFDNIAVASLALDSFATRSVSSVGLRERGFLVVILLVLVEVTCII